jgi:hypothetical protein
MLAIKRLWNCNNPNHTIVEDANYTAEFEYAVLQMPAEGYSLVCEFCSSHCLSCNNSYANCLQCEENYVLTVFALNISCVPCHPNCYGGCSSGDDFSKCNSCQPTTFFHNGSCLDSCPPSFFPTIIDPNGTQGCQTCK